MGPILASARAETESAPAPSTGRRAIPQQLLFIFTNYKQLWDNCFSSLAVRNGAKYTPAIEWTISVHTTSMKLIIPRESVPGLFFNKTANTDVGSL